MKKNKKSFKRILAFILILAGVGTMTFPFAKRSVNTYVNKKEYKEFVKKTDPKEDEKLVKKAQAYNKKIKKSTQAMVDPFDKKNFENETILRIKFSPISLYPSLISTCLYIWMLALII